jgi:hypothetical protein
MDFLSQAAPFQSDRYEEEPEYYLSAPQLFAHRHQGASLSSDALNLGRRLEHQHQNERHMLQNQGTFFTNSSHPNLDIEPPHENLQSPPSANHFGCLYPLKDKPKNIHPASIFGLDDDRRVESRMPPPPRRGDRRHHETGLNRDSLFSADFIVPNTASILRHATDITDTLSFHRAAPPAKSDISKPIIAPPFAGKRKYHSGMNSAVLQHPVDSYYYEQETKLQLQLQQQQHRLQDKLTPPGLSRFRKLPPVSQRDDDPFGSIILPAGSEQIDRPLDDWEQASMANPRLACETKSECREFEPAGDDVQRTGELHVPWTGIQFFNNGVEVDVTGRPFSKSKISSSANKTPPILLDFHPNTKE